MNRFRSTLIHIPMTSVRTLGSDAQSGSGLLPHSFWPALVLFFLSWISGGFPQALAEQRVRKVHISGNVRIPAESIVHRLTTRPHQVYRKESVETDIRRLFQLGCFSMIDVRTEELPDARLDVAFRVRESPFVSGFHIEGVGDGLKAAVLQELKQRARLIQPAQPYRPAQAKEVALLAREFLFKRAYPMVTTSVREESMDHSIRVTLQIRLGPCVDVGKILFQGNQHLSDRTLLGAMANGKTAMLPSWISAVIPYGPWQRWKRPKALDRKGLADDLERIRQLYHSYGHAAVKFGGPHFAVRELGPGSWSVPALGGSRRMSMEITIPIQEGPVFALEAVEVVGSAERARDDIGRIARSIRVPRPYDLRELDRLRSEMIEALGSRGYALSRVHLDQSVDHQRTTVRAVFTVSAGPEYPVGQIRFKGNVRFRDKVLRRVVTLEERASFDPKKLRESIRRLNDTGLIEEIGEGAVDIQPDRRDGVVDIEFRVQERKPRGVYFTRGSRSGSLGLMVTVIDLLGLGEHWAIEMDGGRSFSNWTLDLASRYFLGSSFHLALSGFHHLSHFDIAGFVPEPSDLLKLFKRRTVGWDLLASRSVSESKDCGFGVRTRYSSLGSPQYGWVSRFSSRTQNNGKDLGTRFSLEQTLWGGNLVGSAEAVRSEFDYEGVASDPWSSGRNTLALRVRAQAVRSLAAGGLPAKYRIFPGGELVRGFEDDSLTSWSLQPRTVASANQDRGAYQIRPEGIDSAWATSLEYRVPLGGVLDGVAFGDLGWSWLHPDSIGGPTSPDNLSSLLANGVFRSSIGGELQVRLPARRKARVVFAWNPLRLRSWLSGYGASSVRLHDPGHAVRLLFSR